MEKEKRRFWKIPRSYMLSIDLMRRILSKRVKRSLANLGS